MACWAAAIGPARAAPQPDPSGDWTGALSTPIGLLRIVVHIRREPNGYAGTLDSPDQDATGLTVNEIVAASGELSFSVPAVQGRFKGRWAPVKPAWAGTFTQAGLGLPLELSRPGS